MMWGRHKENGIWLNATPRRRLMIRHHDSFYLALGRIRVRFMYPRMRRGDAKT